ncbi:hypothetical protein A0U40_17870 [[Bacillus] sp. KCTC 13219]|nr:hypothetical protein A0U40_17870 [[Bacillus] sp. KCTC 13219]
MSCEKQPLDIDELRLLVDDTDPVDQMFTDEQYLKMYRSFTNIYRLAAHIWMLKATRLQKDMGGIKSYSDGDEKYEMTALNDMYKYYVNMRNQMLELAEQYEKECEGGYDGGSLILSFKVPDIL